MTPKVSRGDYENRENGSQILTLQGQSQFWLTPMVPNGGRIGTRQEPGREGRERYLENQSLMWMTPRAAMATNGDDSGSANRQKQGPNPGLKVQAAETTMWATPNATAGKRDHPMPDASIGRPRGEPKELTYQVHQWPTPLRSDCGEKVTLASHQASLLFAAAECHYSLQGHPTTQPGESSSPPTPTSRPRLNPRFVEWLMGWPLGWTDFAPVGMEYTRWQQHMRSYLFYLACIKTNQL
jgi:DNA (cytosine-5)-methyltransferase 1